MPTRGHKFKICKPHCKSNARKNTFSVQVRSIKSWNNLPEELVTTNGVNSFKSILNKVWRNNPLKFNPGVTNVEYPGIFGDNVIAKMPKVKVIAVLPYPYSNWTTFQK